MPELTYILAVDHGTSGIKTSIVSTNGEVIATESESLPTIYADDGTAEQDPEGWWRALLTTGRRLVARGLVPPAAIRAVCVSSTFSTTVAVGRDGRHLMNAVTWLDTRGAPYVRRLMRGFPSFQGYGVAKALRWIRKTGGAPTLTGKDDLAHALFIQHAHPDVYAKTRTFLPSKDYLNLRLTGRGVASFDSVTLFWLTDTRDPLNVHYDENLVRASGLDAEKLPPLVPSTEVIGKLLPDVARALGVGDDVAVVCGSPDHQSAGIGAGSVDDFDGHLYIGTSSWIQCTVPFKKTDVLHSIASLPTAIPGKYYCANEQDLAGGCLSFLLDNVMFHKNALLRADPPAASYAMLDAVAGSVAPGSGGLIFTPWLNGERTPVDDAYLRGGLYNISKTTNLDHIARAVLEGVAFNTRWSLRYVEKFIGRPMPHIRFVGGGAQSDVWCQILADVLDREVRRMSQPREANARGAALIAAVGLGLRRFEEIPAMVPVDRAFLPNSRNRATYDRMFDVFVDIYRSTRSLYRRLNEGRS